MKLEPIENEEWVQIDGIPGYYVSNMGRIKSDKEGIKPVVNKKTGLAQAMTYVNGKAKLLNVQNVVARHFLPPAPDEGMIARHISADLTDNRVENLVWAYRGRIKNQEAGIILAKAPAKPRASHYRYIIKQIVPHTKLVVATYVNWDTLAEMGYRRANIMTCTRGKSFKETYKGFCWSVQKVRID